MVGEDIKNRLLQPYKVCNTMHLKVRGWRWPNRNLFKIQIDFRSQEKAEIRFVVFNIVCIKF